MSRSRDCLLAWSAPFLVICAAHGPALAQEPAAPEAEPAPAEPAPAAAEPAPVEPAEAVASAEPPAEPVTVEAAAPPAPEAKPKPQPYSLPWQLRPVVPGNVVRSDTALAFHESPQSGESGTTVASMLLFSYKVIPELAPLVRLGVVSSSPPAPGESAFNFINPVIGATYGPNIGNNLKLGLFLGLTIPVGMGGGEDPEPANAAANAAGIPARSAMDNAMFAVNYFTIFPGIGFAYVSGGLTVQVEATVLQLTKTRGPDAADDSNTNFTAGLHVGYFVIPMLSLGAEIRHQRWLSTPAAVENGGEALRDTSTFAIGPRFHFKLAESTWLRPGIAFAMPIDEPMSDSKYEIVQIDLPLAF